MVRYEMPRGKYPVVQIAGVCAESLKQKPVYLCGPVTGTADYRERFAAAGELLHDIGFSNVIFNPAEIIEFHGMEKESNRCILDFLMPFVERSGSLCHLPGWGNSEGAREETAYAQKLGLVIFDIVGDTLRLSPSFLQGGKE